MRLGVVAVIMLIIGIIVGIGAGYVLTPTVTTTTTLTSVITSPTTITTVSPTTIHRTVTITLTVTVEAPVKAEWTSGDGRLKVSSETIPDRIGGEIVSYTVKVTITNVSDKPISKVLIIIFPYIRDRLFEHWNWASHSAEITSLMPGESVTHEFLLLPKDMTSYKITAFAL